MVSKYLVKENNGSMKLDRINKTTNYIRKNVK